MARHAAGHGRHSRNKKRSWANWLHSNRFRGAGKGRRPKVLTSKYWYGI